MTPSDIFEADLGKKQLFYNSKWVN
jgi:hypothetical protein